MSCPQDTSLVVSTVNFVVYTDVHHGAFVFGFFQYWRPLDSRTRTRFDLKFFRVFLKIDITKSFGSLFSTGKVHGSFQALSRSQNVESPAQYSPLKKRRVNLAELKFEKTSGTVTEDRGKK